MSRIIIVDSLQEGWPVLYLQSLVGSFFTPIDKNPGLMPNRWTAINNEGFLVPAQDVLAALEKRNQEAANWLADKYFPGSITAGYAIVFFNRSACFLKEQNED
jgi:hypothetical protein